MKDPTDQPMSRRARLRVQTSDEIKAIALRQMADGGPGAISLRAIARDMGMTAGAIYSYFATRDDLLTTLIGDLYGSLVETAEAARDALPQDDPGGRIQAWAYAVRSWALAHPEGFRLIYGDPVPGYQEPADSPGKAAGLRACTGLVGLVAAAWPTARAAAPAGRDYGWDDFDPGLVGHVREEFPELPPQAVALTLRVWGRMHGLMALELYGHLSPLIGAPATVYRDEMDALIASLGLSAS
ncbi:TetR/AcrR family transcriptional regulator [Streptomyces sp. NPDC057694]|uniref:TetR/AcrR family transcriptional regulator n=1 Tax=Streptomyces sp. NPDC057694 TaxID=3346216 RepID=UPI0036A1AB1E